MGLIGEELSCLSLDEAVRFLHKMSRKTLVHVLRKSSTDCDGFKAEGTPEVILHLVSRVSCQASLSLD